MQTGNRFRNLMLVRFRFSGFCRVGGRLRDDMTGKTVVKRAVLGHLQRENGTGGCETSGSSENLNKFA